MKMIDEKFEDVNGRKYRLYTVRHLDSGFGILDRYRNAFISAYCFKTRAAAWDYLKNTEA